MVVHSVGSYSISNSSNHGSLHSLQPVVNPQIHDRKKLKKKCANIPKHGDEQWGGEMYRFLWVYIS